MNDQGHDTYGKLEKELLERKSMTDHSHICNSLAANGYIVCPNFYLKHDVAQARNDIAKLHEANELKRAAIGRGSSSQTIEEVRGDFTYWLEAHDSNPIRSKLHELTDELMNSMNRELFLGVSEFEGHYAYYPAGSSYQRHSDVHKQTDARVVSFILYLNSPDWTDADGGQLRLYFDNQSHLDVRPEGGTLVCFMSDRFEHEVLQAKRDRYSFTGWFRRRSSVS